MCNSCIGDQATTISRARTRNLCIFFTCSSRSLWHALLHFFSLASGCTDQTAFLYQLKNVLRIISSALKFYVSLKLDEIDRFFSVDTLGLFDLDLFLQIIRDTSKFHASWKLDEIDWFASVDTLGLFDPDSFLRIFPNILKFYVNRGNSMKSMDSPPLTHWVFLTQTHFFAAIYPTDF